MFRRIALILAGALAGITLVAVPAHAAYSDCPNELICFWWGQGGTGQRYDFQVTIGGAPYIDTYVGEPVRSNAHSMKNNKVNTYISKRNKETGCSAFNFDQPNLHKGQTYSFNPLTTCFRTDWV